MLEILKWNVPEATWIEQCILGMRWSWESQHKSDSTFHVTEVYDYFELGEKDRELANRLTNAGTDHGKYLRQIPILLDVRAPNYFWVEFDTYKVSTVRNSTSKMHVLGKERFHENMFSVEDVRPEFKRRMIELLNEARDEWIEAGKKKGPEREKWRQMIQLIPDSWIYFSTWSGNYQNLRDMYFARRNHRLKEWRQFCAFIERLPYSELITVEKE